YFFCGGARGPSRGLLAPARYPTGWGDSKLGLYLQGLPRELLPRARLSETGARQAPATAVRPPEAKRPARAPPWRAAGAFPFVYLASHVFIRRELTAGPSHYQTHAPQ